jgi:hypothetical protein
MIMGVSLAVALALIMRATVIMMDCATYRKLYIPLMHIYNRVNQPTMKRIIVLLGLLLLTYSVSGATNPPEPPATSGTTTSIESIILAINNMATKVSKLETDMRELRYSLDEKVEAMQTNTMLFLLSAYIGLFAIEKLVGRIWHYFMYQRTRRETMTLVGEMQVAVRETTDYVNTINEQYAHSTQQLIKLNDELIKTKKSLSVIRGQLTKMENRGQEVEKPPGDDPKKPQGASLTERLKGFVTGKKKPEASRQLAHSVKTPANMLKDAVSGKKSRGVQWL